MEDPSLFPIRLKQARLKKNLTQEQLAALVKVSRASIQSYERGNTRPRSGPMAAMALALECDMKWLAGLSDFGPEKFDNMDDYLKRPKYAHPDKLYEPNYSWQLDDFERIIKIDAFNEHNTADFNKSDLATVPIVRGRLSASSGWLENAEKPHDYIVFNKEWLLKLGTPKNFKALEVLGDSMEPLICNNDLVIFDISDRYDIRSGKVYAVTTDGYIYLKRLYIEPGRLILRSDNKAYSDIAISLPRNTSEAPVYLLGRVIWWSHADKA
jgi:Predicted transcriptional regulator